MGRPYPEQQHDLKIIHTLAKSFSYVFVLMIFFKHLYHQTKHLGHEKIFISNSMDFES